MFKIEIKGLDEVIASIEAEAKKKIDNAEQELTCPKCGHKFRKTFGEMKNNRVFDCPACKARIELCSLE